MSSFEICNFEEFVAEVTPQSGSLEEAASASEILIQQVEGYLQRMKAAMCADVLALEAQIAALTPGGGGEVWKISERRANAVQAIGTVSNTAIDFEVAGINDAPGELTWDAVAFAWENVSGAVLHVNVLITVSCQNSGGSGRPLFVVRRDTGGGFADEPGGVFFDEVGRMGTGKVLRMDLAAGDKVGLWGRAIVGTVNMINDSSFQLLSRTTTP